MSLNIFVYGTLKRGEWAHYLLQKGNKDLQPISPPETFVKGHLFDSGHFPSAWIPMNIRLAKAQSYELDQRKQKEQEAKAKGVIADSKYSIDGMNIFGEIYQVDEELIRTIDHYEGAGHMLLRVLTFAYLPNVEGYFTKLPVWVHTIVDQYDTFQLTQIPTGNWILLGPIRRTL